MLYSYHSTATPEQRRIFFSSFKFAVASHVCGADDMMKRKFYSEKTIQLLLLIDALKSTSQENPKTAAELQRNLEGAWENLFPGVPMTPISASTIGRHIFDLNATGLYDIETCKNMRDGYYSNHVLLDAAEFSIIAQALYRNTTLTVNDTKRIVEKFLNQIDDLGEVHLDILSKQLTRMRMRRKSQRDTLPMIRKLMKAIWKGQQVAFRYRHYAFSGRIDVERVEVTEVVKDHATGIDRTFFVSPYFLVCEADTCYLIGHVEDDPRMTSGRLRKERHNRYLTHFKISLIGSGIHLLSRSRTPIYDMKEYRRYSMRRTLPEQTAMGKYKMMSVGKDVEDGVAMTKFSLDRYLRENLYMYHDDSDVVDVKLHFCEEYIGEIMERFNLNQRMLQAVRTGRQDARGRQVCSAIITAQPNEGFYRWVMGQGGNIRVVEPEAIRREVQRRLYHAWNTMMEYEKSDNKDPIDDEALTEKKQKDASYEMLYDMALSIEMEAPQQMKE